MKHTDNSSVPAADQETEGPTGILLTHDLIFTSKVIGTAQALGYRVLVAGSPLLAASMIEQYRPRVVFIDLAATDLAAPQMLRDYQKLTGSETVFIAFGSHVDADVLAAARAAGCDPVMPRSKFSAELPALIPRLFQSDR
jgi:hypothetical protein